MEQSRAVAPGESPDQREKGATRKKGAGWLQAITDHLLSWGRLGRVCEREVKPTMSWVTVESVILISKAC